MRRHALRSLLLAAPLAVSCGALAVALARQGAAGLGLDYAWDAGPAIAGLSHGDVAAFVHQQPAMGLFSLLLRAPLAALAPRTNVDAAYVLGLLPCLLVVALVGRELRREVLARRGDGPAARLVLPLMLLSAPVLEALVYGHPEEPLGAALCVAAALAGMRRRPVAAGLLLGLAVATKQWGAFAVLPVLLAGTGSRARTLAVAGAVVAILSAPAVIGDAHQFASIQHAAASGTTSAAPLSLWAPVSHPASDRGFAGFAVHLTAPGYVASLSRPLMAMWIALVLAGFALRRRRSEDVMAVLALVFLGRCLLDPMDNIYYHAPFLLSLCAWEALGRRRVPWMSLASTAVLGTLALAGRLNVHDATVLMTLYLAWALPVAAGLARAVLLTREQRALLPRSPALAASH